MILATFSPIQPIRPINPTASEEHLALQDMKSAHLGGLRLPVEGPGKYPMPKDPRTGWTSQQGGDPETSYEHRGIFFKDSSR